MYAIYRYVDMNDKKIKYIGIIHEENRMLKERIIEHFKKDVWSHGFFRVDYIEVNNRTDAEFLESHFIAYYKTFKYFNIAKKNWGESDVYPKGKYKWKVYIIYDNDLTLENIEHKKCDPKLFEKKSKIWQSTDKNWYTFVPDALKGRRLIKRKSKEALLKYVQDFYMQYEEEVVDFDKKSN